MAGLNDKRLARIRWWMVLAVCFVFSGQAWAQVLQSPWQLYSLDANQSFAPTIPLSKQGFQKADEISLVGGHYVYSGHIKLPLDGRYVIDFKNTSAIDQFAFYLYDQDHQLVATAEGGIGNPTLNPFFLRHGREFQLAAGQYHLITEVSSPYFIAPPSPYVETLETYQQEIKWGNAIVLIGIGIFLSMGIYYGALSFARSRNTEILYAIFIFSNLLFNLGAHQIFAQLFGMHNFYLISMPILVSNFIYVLFVMRLLDINSAQHEKLHLMGIASLVVLAIFALFAILSPHWINEMARFGVWVFLLYGLVAGTARSLQGSVVARLYLIALTAFVLLASMATIPTHLGSNSIYVEHYGLAAIATEIILLALVMTYQVGELYRERMKILLRLDDSNKMAHTDALTQIPNRYALEMELSAFPVDGSLTYVDMDNLKLYNDRFGHAKGDEVLVLFASLIQQGLIEGESIYRVGGDEFAVTSRDGQAQRLEALVCKVILRMQEAGFDHIGASFGTAFLHEVDSTVDLKHLADIRMYEHKQQRKTHVNQEER